jgi:tetratricopeptide (TPR) repeat protein
MQGVAKTVALCVSVIVLLSSPAQAQLNAKENAAPTMVVQDQLSKSKQLLRERQPKAALNVLLETVRVFPGNPEVHFWLGVAFEQLRDFNQATTAFAHSLVVARNNGMDCAEARCNLGSLQEQRGKLDEAIANYRRASQVDPHFIGAHLCLVRALLKKRQPAEALEQLEKCVDLGCTDPAMTYYRALALRQQGKEKESQAQMQQFQSGLPANPGSAHLKEEINCRFTPVGSAGR